MSIEIRPDSPPLHIQVSTPSVALPGAMGEDSIGMLTGRRGSEVRSLYIHVPFCSRKCGYCAFFSESGNAALMDRYVSAVIREVESCAVTVQPRTIFFGGGTPSLLPLSLWQRLFEALRQYRLLPAAECTVECNPATLSLEKAKFLRENGVNRVSLGVQSLEESLLNRLGRIHSRDAVFRSFDRLRLAGFDNINVDLMFAIPGQTLDHWRRTLDEALALESEHLACYELIYEEDTPLFKQLAAGHVGVDEDLAAAMYEHLLERTAACQLHQYEVANFARHQTPGCVWIPDRACRHNVNYWRGGSFFGLGPSASGYVQGVRTRNVANTVRYCELIEENQSPVDTSDTLPPLARAGEIAAFGLRMPTGWSFDEFEDVTGFDLLHHWRPDLEKLVARGWGHLDSAGFRLTASGLRFADAAAECLLR
jgi:oxygen-independent coproporphyrinogen III oxidase